MRNAVFLCFFISFASLFSCAVLPESRDKPFTQHLQAAENGDSDAQYRIGLMYLNGEGVSQDLPQAVWWYRKAAEQGNSEAQFGLGVLYFHGQGVPENTEETAKWYRRAAEQGNADGQLGLGLLYLLGKGVRQDGKKAYIWLDLAAAQGNTQAEIVRGMVEKDLDPEILSQAKILSKEYYIKYVAPFGTPS